VLLEALKELAAENDQMKKRIDALEGSVSEHATAMQDCL
jgi:hypothetical protein